MKTYIGLLLLVIGLSISGFSNADDETPKAQLRMMLQAEVTDSQFPALLVRVDGKQYIQGNRRVIEIDAGKHVIALEPDRDALVRFEKQGVRNIPLPRDFSEKTLEVELEAGATYMLSARIVDSDYQNWEPVLTRVASE